MSSLLGLIQFIDWRYSQPRSRPYTTRPRLISYTGCGWFTLTTRQQGRLGIDHQLTNYRTVCNKQCHRSTIGILPLYRYYMLLKKRLRCDQKHGYKKEMLRQFDSEDRQQRSITQVISSRRIISSSRRSEGRQKSFEGAKHPPPFHWDRRAIWQPTISNLCQATLLRPCELSLYAKVLNKLLQIREVNVCPHADPDQFFNQIRPDPDPKIKLPFFLKFFLIKHLQI